MPKPASKPGSDHKTQNPEPAGLPTDWSFLAPPQKPGELGRFAHYRIFHLLGTGGMSLVFLAEDVRYHRKIALKVLKPEFVSDEDARPRFVREAQLTAKIKHDHIITIHEVGQVGDLPFIAMEYFDGVMLAEWMEANPHPPIRTVLALAKDIASGLSAAHANGLIHRDIKPTNIMINEATGQVKILDFGLARAIKPDVSLTRKGFIVGTPAFMSPEQARGGQLDHRSDLFSFGILLYLMCTGKLPFHGQNPLEILTNLCTEHPKPVHERNHTVPFAMSELIARLLGKKREQRPSFAAEVIASLEQIEQEMTRAEGMLEIQENNDTLITPLPSRRTDPNLAQALLQAPPMLRPIAMTQTWKTRLWLYVGIPLLFALIFYGLLLFGWWLLRAS